jgi:tetratricopeptide (TPR) repeat protein
MRIKSLVKVVLITLLFLAVPHTTSAQKDGEAQAVTFDAHNRATLKFSDKGEKRADCGFFVSHTLMENQEEAFVLKVIHMHDGPEERGWLYITPSRAVFRVVIGDRSHAFDVPRTALKDKSVTNAGTRYAGLQINLKEKLPATNSSEQKFGSIVTGDKTCYPRDPSRFNKFLEHAVNDFTAAMAEFKQISTSLKQAGKIQQAAPQTGDATSSKLIEPADGVYSAMISSIMFGMGRTEPAREKAKEALRLLATHKEDFEFYWATAEANHVLGNYDVAIVNSSKALQLNPEHLGVHVCRGRSYFRKGDYDLALLDFNKAIELAPKFTEVYFDRGLTYYDKHDYDRAIADFDKVTELNRKAIRAYIMRGGAYFEKGDNDRVIAEFSEVIRLQPDYIPAYQIRAKAYEKIGDKVKAQADWDKAAELEKQKAKP